MDPQKTIVEFQTELRGKNAANFWIGVIVVIVAFYLAWQGWFTKAAILFGFIDPPEGLEAGAVSMIIDTFCLIGLLSTVAFKFMRGAISALSERVSFLSTGLLAWSAKEQGEAKPTPPLAGSKELDALRNHEVRLRQLEAMFSIHDDKLAAIDAEIGIDDDFDDDFDDLDDAPDHDDDAIDFVERSELDEVVKLNRELTQEIRNLQSLLTPAVTEVTYSDSASSEASE